MFQTTYGFMDWYEKSIIAEWNVRRKDFLEFLNCWGCRMKRHGNHDQYICRSKNPERIAKYHGMASFPMSQNYGKDMRPKEVSSILLLLGAKEDFRSWMREEKNINL